MTINSKFVYYPKILEQINLKFVPNDKVYRPYEGLDFYYLTNIKNPESPFYISSNTQLSEFLNKFNESDILPKLGKIKYKEILNDINFKIDIKELKENYGWNWINWNSSQGKKVIDQLDQLNKRKIKKFEDLNSQTTKILGRIRLKESTDYGINVENAINNFLINNEIDPKYEWEIYEFCEILNKNKLVVIGFSKRIIHHDGIFTGIIDYILMSKETKKIIITDLKTSSIADNLDYWRQILFYYKLLISLNYQLKNNFSTELSIIHINKKKKISIIYKRDFKNSNLDKLLDQVIYTKKIYLNLLTNMK